MAPKGQLLSVVNTNSKTFDYSSSVAIDDAYAAPKLCLTFYMAGGQISNNACHPKPLKRFSRLTERWKHWFCDLTR